METKNLIVSLMLFLDHSHFFHFGETKTILTALSEITSGDAGFFLIFWLGGWSLGGVFAASMLYNVFKKKVPEQLLLNRPKLSLDTGSPTLQTTGRRNRKANIKSLYRKRQRIEFNESEVKSLQLRETGTGNRLTIDKGTERFDIAGSATEIEREWLFKYLQRNYTLT